MSGIQFITRIIVESDETRGEANENEATESEATNQEMVDRTYTLHIGHDLADSFAVKS